MRLLWPSRKVYETIFQAVGGTRALVDGDKVIDVLVMT